MDVRQSFAKKSDGSVPSFGISFPGGKKVRSRLGGTNRKTRSIILPGFANLDWKERPLSVRFKEKPSGIFRQGLV